MNYRYEYQVGAAQQAVLCHDLVWLQGCHVRNIGTAGGGATRNSTAPEERNQALISLVV